MSKEEFLRILRIVYFLLGSLIVVYLMILPDAFDGSPMPLSGLIFAWVGAFVMRRPKSVNIVVLAFAALIFAAYTDDGLALGALSLFFYGLILRQYHTRLFYQSFAYEWMMLSALFLGVHIARNILLMVFFSPHHGWLASFFMVLIFILAYPLLNFFVHIIVGARRTEIAGD